MARTKHGKSWMARHLSDPYVKKAQQQGYRSRASFKLLEIQQKDNLFRPGMTVLDLGSAPGGWSQVVASIVGSKGKVVALDILEMSPLPGVTVLQGDFLEDETIGKLQTMLGEDKKEKQIDWVLSDMSPNLSGVM